MIHLTTLLPVSPTILTTDLRQKINEYLFLLHSVVQATKLLQQDRFDQFDPLVGDNACQIRALKICLITKSCCDSLSSVMPDVGAAIVQIEKLLSTENIPRKGILQDFLIKHNLIIEISENDLYMIGCYLLTIVKHELPPKFDLPLVMNEVSRPLSLRAVFSSTSSQFLRNLTDQVRKYIAKSSVAFVRQEAQHLCDLKLSHMVSSQYTIHHYNLDCIPIFWSSLIIMRRAKQLEIPIVLIIDRKDEDYKTIESVSIIFKSGSIYYPIDTVDNPDQLAIVIKGISKGQLKENWINILLSYDPSDLFIAYSAVHRQYPDQSKDELVTKDSDSLFEDYYNKCLIWECCLDNPSLFFTTHISCQKLKNIEKFLPALSYSCQKF